MPEIHGIELEQWITKLNDMDRVLHDRIEAMEAHYMNQKVSNTREVDDLTKTVCQLICDIEQLKEKE